MNPKVTVLMPAYNAGKYIAESIQSIINQTYENWELLIVNDGSTDNTVEVVNSFNDPRIRLLNNPENLRLIKTLNRGLHEARGELIARLDSDDNATSNRLQLQVDAFERNSDLALLGGRSHIIDENGKLLKDGSTVFQPENPAAVRWACVFYNPFRHSAVMFKRSIVWEVIGGYPEDAKDLEDYALWSKIVANYEAANLPEVLCDYRVHSDSILANARAKNALMEDPRRLCAEPYFRLNAVTAGISDQDASEWAKLWPCVRFKQVGDLRRLDCILKALIGVVAQQPSVAGSRDELKAVSAEAYYKLYRIVRTQGDLKLWLRASFYGIRLFGWSSIRFFLGGISRRLRFKRETV